MNKTKARAVARRAELSQEAFVGLWSSALWILGAVYLLATVSIH